MTGQDANEPDTDINEHTFDVNVIPPLGEAQLLICEPTC